MPKRIVVIGGGISGLSAVNRLLELKKERNLDIEVFLIEKSGRLGGAISTIKKNGYLVELGPDMFFTQKPWALKLSKRLGLDPELIETNEHKRGTSILRQGKLISVPEGFLMLAPSKILPFLGSPLFSWKGKLRMLMDTIIPKKESGDESVASFVRRRLGKEALERIAQPMIGGIYTGDPERLSLRATMPQFALMEEKYGSVIRGMMKNKSETSTDSGARYSQFLSFRGGMQCLINTLQDRITEQSIYLNEAAEKISLNTDSWEIETQQRKIDASSVIITIPAYHAATLLKDIDESLYEELSSIEYASSAVVILAYKKEHITHDLNGFGFVVPDTEDSNLIACSYSSNKFDGRAPDDSVILRAFVGGILKPGILNLDDDKIIEKVQNELSEVLGIKSAPEFTMIERYPDAMPQYNIGHISKVEAINKKVSGYKGLQIAGNTYTGVGIPDSIHSAESAAESVLDEIL